MPRKLTPEAARALLDRRKARDPLEHYVPIPTFQECSKEKARFICIQAPNQVGKSIYLTFIAASLLRGKHPYLPYFGPSKGLLVIPSRAQAAEIYGVRLLKKSELAGPMKEFPFLPKHDIARVDWAVSPVGRYPGKITMRDGSTLMVVLSGDPNSWKRLEGMTFDWVIRDEVAGSENMGNELVPRLVASHSRMLSGEQPWGGRMWWAATETKFNEEWNDYKTRCKSHVEDHAVYNPKPEEAHSYVSMEARQAMSTTMSASAYKIRGTGDLDAGDLVQIYGKQWDDKRHMLPVDYVIKPTDNINIGYDPGIDHPTGIVIGVNSMDNPTQIKIVKCFLHARESLDFDVECLHSFLLGRKIATLVYDIAAATRHKHARSLIHELIDRMQSKGYVPMGGYLKSDKRHSVGINSMREYLDPRPFDKTATPLLVLNSSAESGCQVLRSELIGYHGRESTAFTGAGGVIKKSDDLCFSAETPVLMADGTSRPIIDVIAGDYVHTPIGPRRVLGSWMTSSNAEVKKYELSNGESITCTPNHRAWVNGTEWRPIDTVGYADTLWAWTTPQNKSPSPTTESSSTVSAHWTAGSSKTGTASCSIASNTPPSAGKYRKAGTFTTWTTIASITTLIISWLFHRKTTSANMSETCRRPRWTLPLSGTDRQQDSLSTQSLPGSASQSVSTITSASNAGRNAILSGRSSALCSAVTTASHSGAESQASMTSTGHAQPADASSKLIATLQSKHADVHVLQSSIMPRQPVYDIEVEDAHCFYATNVLVHNCDASRYLIRSSPSWHSAYQCGLTSYVAHDPMQSAPDKIIVTQAMTLEAHRSRLSAQMANRTKQSIRNQYSWQHRQAIQLGMR